MARLTLKKDGMVFYYCSMDMVIHQLQLLGGARRLEPPYIIETEIVVDGKNMIETITIEADIDEEEFIG